jgi:hypothetical protein
MVATKNYIYGNGSDIKGRKKYGRPQAMLFADNPGKLENGFYIPGGFEIGADTGTESDTTLFNQFIILSDDNRSPLDFKPTRIEKRERMINGRMRSYHIADKWTISASWDMLPSRAFDKTPLFDEDGKPVDNAPTRAAAANYTTDGGAGGADLLDWYENHRGSFWVYLAYDKLNNFSATEADQDAAYNNLGKYSQVMEVFISDFNYSVQKRGGMFDFWNVSITLEEV